MSKLFEEMKVVSSFADIKEYYGDLLSSFDWYYSKWLPRNDGKIRCVFFMADTYSYVIVTNREVVKEYDKE